MESSVVGHEAAELPQPLTGVRQDRVAAAPLGALGADDVRYGHRASPMRR